MNMHGHDGEPLPKETDGFCDRAMAASMSMGGFETKTWHREYGCVIFIFHSWVLDTPVKFAAGCLGSALLACSFRLTSGFKAALQQQLCTYCRCCSRAVVEALLAGVLALLGWLVMLVVMTCCVELFASCLLGTMLGQYLLARNDWELIKQKKERAKDHVSDSDTCYTELATVDSDACC
eukprot:TRINITY_DN77569_c0_g1_i1.p1 TRINITY_DN77569_c0_g1~~TRINITY_DN77569_c0_g1_i1.p1  ORF type:complete len:179 (+),score=35.53 TRINITY_DN77569_c0_g1_i1:81-617(+)